MEKWYCLNFDYEYELYDIDLPSVKRDVICAEFDYLLFYLPLDGGVLLRRAISEEFYQSVPFKHPYLTKRRDVTNYWGALENVEVERKLNSKIFSLEIENELDINFCDKQLCRNKQELDLYIQRHKHQKLLYQHPSLFSGIGQGILDSSHCLKEFPLICSCHLHRRLDFGSVIYPDGNMIRYVNLVNQKGRYVGTILVPDDEFSFLVAQMVGKPLEVVETVLTENLHHLYKVDKRVREEGANAPCQYDSFLFDDGVLRSYPLVEINYRKSMGQLFYQMNLVRQDHYCFFWLQLKSESIIGVGEKLSPDGRRFSLFRYIAPNLQNLVERVTQLKTSL